MKFSHLLAVTTAVLSIASAARAADAVEVVAEPEPVEYLRVCDVYGAGFYYIAGTETCLRVGGYLRYDIGVGGLFGQADVLDKRDFVNGVLNTNDSYYKRARASLELDARSETELGTLRGYMQINFQWDSTVASIAEGDLTTTETSVEMEHGYIELGGFRIGKTDSLFSTFTDYAGAVINDDFLVPYGPYDTHQIAYTYSASNGFTAAVALEEGSGGELDIDGDGVVDIPDAYTIDSYIPHIVAGAGYAAGWGGVTVVGGYDSVWEEFAVRARLDVKPSEALSLFVMGGYKSDADRPNYYGTWAGDWAIWGGGTAQLSEKAAANVQLAYDDGDNFSAVANVEYQLVPGMTITPEVAYGDNLDDDDDGEFGGFLRFERAF